VHLRVPIPRTSKSGIKLGCQHVYLRLLKGSFDSCELQAAREASSCVPYPLAILQAGRGRLTN
jgi:hypothetical protein